MPAVETFVAYDEETETYPHGRGPVGMTRVLKPSGLLCTITRWDTLGIRVIERYKDGRMYMRVVDYD